ncbi:starch synthase [Gillisia mitskevichiae]|uniref:Glycogen synthase n=1 Tax=Gillisia mitskevichiae TaxID=270921 RepID=A0A495PTP0_9FLAO|nr:glycogen/starch synthase [Gillisia mitskevichiae]RKS53931.1 starch synthase [Gillisia mitskevichiae]
MKIIHISAECFPIAKVGGLADVVGALPKYQNNVTTISQVVMPFYNNKFTQENKFKSIYKGILKLGTDSIDFKILIPELNTLGYDLFLVDIPKLLFTDYVYSDNDTERFLAFQIAALDWILQNKKLPNIIHCHDHHTGLIPFMMSHANNYRELKNIPSVFTIHNAQYQGWFSHDKIDLLPSFPLSLIGLLDWNNCVNPLATAIKCAWLVTTVSPSYMEELKVKANGLESLITSESQKCIGILNGIDIKVWNPETDDLIQAKYNSSNCNNGKKASKDWLCEKFSLDPEKPLFVFIGRLVGEKGADLFYELFEHALKNLDISILLLGSGSKQIEEQLSKLTSKYPNSYNAYIGYDEALSHNMYAGGDFLLMPSRVEPCGLNQMYSLRYGTIPIVNKIGGLKDTVIDVSKNGFGFVHTENTVEGIFNSMKRASQFYNDTSKFKDTRKTIMQIDHSWDESAQQYVSLYKSLIQNL